MPRAAVEPPVHRTVADLLEAVKPLGDIPPGRIRLHPAPGTATERDVLDVLDHEGRICELIDGTLVEKAMGFDESMVAVELITELKLFLRRHNLGIVAGPDGTLTPTTGLLRVPDVTFVSWDRLPGRKRPAGPVPRLSIDLAVEVISTNNTKAEMERKLREYFDAGTRLVWFLDPKYRTARVCTAPDHVTRLNEDQSLDGGDVLPGFTLSLRELFGRANQGPDD
ncbi:MAG TPA: Uma2 family endonuclease [Isosphaeraceae bacterium]